MSFIYHSVPNDAHHTQKGHLCPKFTRLVPFEFPRENPDMNDDAPRHTVWRGITTVHRESRQLFKQAVQGLCVRCKRGVVHTKAPSANSSLLVVHDLSYQTHSTPKALNYEEGLKVRSIQVTNIQCPTRQQAHLCTSGLSGVSRRGKL